jgi:hypothetical protein
MLEWATHQQHFRIAWEHLLGRELSDLARQRDPADRVLNMAQQTLGKSVVGVVPIGHFRIIDAGLAFAADTLFGALHIKLMAISETGMVRRCANPACRFEPYFIALHGRQQYCSPGCSEWGQSRGKKIWWQNKGTEWRQRRASEKNATVEPPVKRASSKKGANDGTEEAR